MHVKVQRLIDDFKPEHLQAGGYVLPYLVLFIHPSRDLGAGAVRPSFEQLDDLPDVIMLIKESGSIHPRPVMMDLALACNKEASDRLYLFGEHREKVSAWSRGRRRGTFSRTRSKEALDWAKEWTLGAAHAAHTDKMSLPTAALARAHGVSAEASNLAVEAVKKVGFGTQDAIHAVDRLMVADMNLSKAEGLAKVAKDAAAIENITPGEALEKLLMAIESGASRGLRTMGIFVDLNKEVDRQEKLTGRTLDENEVRQLRYNAVMREAAKIQGAAAATGSAEAQSAALAREVNELKEAVGEQFQGYLRSWVQNLAGQIVGVDPTVSG